MNVGRKLGIRIWLKKTLCNSTLCTRDGVKLEFVRNLFDSKICDSINSKEQKIFEKLDESQFKFDSFDLTPTIGGSQISRNWICSKFVRFDADCCNVKRACAYAIEAK